MGRRIFRPDSRVVAAEHLAPRAESLLEHQAKSEMSRSPRLPPLAWAYSVFSRRRIVSKAVRFRADACAASPAWPALRGLSHEAGSAGFYLAHVTPHEADRTRRTL